MEITKIIGIGFVGTVISILLKQYKPEFSMYAVIITGLIIFFEIFYKLSSVISLLNSLSTKIGIDIKFIEIILKITGIAYLTDFAVNICKDSR